jgi:hypothetical protein
VEASNDLAVKRGKRPPSILDHLQKLQQLVDDGMGLVDETSEEEGKEEEEEEEGSGENGENSQFAFARCTLKRREVTPVLAYAVIMKNLSNMSRTNSLNALLGHLIKTLEFPAYLTKISTTTNQVHEH